MERGLPADSESLGPPKGCRSHHDQGRSENEDRDRTSAQYIVGEVMSLAAGYFSTCRLTYEILNIDRSHGLRTRTEIESSECLTLIRTGPKQDCDKSAILGTTVRPSGWQATRPYLESLKAPSTGRKEPGVSSNVLAALSTQNGQEKSLQETTFSSKKRLEQE